MEISSYLTNVLSINELSPIHYYYLEPSGSRKSGQNTLSDIEAPWRRSGALVVRYKSGVWVFGKGGEQESILPSSAIIKTEGFVEFYDNTLAVKQQGSFEPSTVWKTSKPLTTPSSVQNGATSPPSSAESTLRSAQLVNAKASHTNATFETNKEKTADPSPIKDDFTVVEPLFSAREIQEHFVSAVLATLSYHLCHDSGFVALNARTLLSSAPNYPRISDEFPQTAGGALKQNNPWLVTLDVHLTSIGTLVVKAWPNAPFNFSRILSPREGSIPLSPLLEGTTLFLCPTGKVARYCGPAILDISESALDVVNPPIEQYSNESSLEGQSMVRWKQRCLSWLADKGMRIDSLESGGWLIVQIRSRTNPLDSIGDGDNGLWSPEEKLVTIAWPAAFCLKRTTSDIVQNSESSLPRGHDPLSFAERWFTSKVIRDATIAKRRKERESAAATAAAVRAQVEIDARNTTLNNFSPAGLRRASIAGAVYPTPPDGVQPAIGATPSFDGNGSTPGHPNNQTMAIDSDVVAIPKSETEYADVNMWDVNEAKGGQISSTLDFNDNENDDLFSDLGDPFGENDITDADFSFFDEPDPIENTGNSPAGEENPLDEVKVVTIENGTLSNNLIDIASRSGEPDVAIARTNQEENHGRNEEQPSARQASILDVSTNIEDLSKTLARVPVRRPPSPPLSPDLIFKRLTAGFSSSNTSSSVRSITSFEGVAFDPSLSAFNKKYGAHGRYNYPSEPKTFDQHVLKVLPKTGYLNKIMKPKSTTVNLLTQALISPEEAPISDKDGDDSPSDLESQGYSHAASPISDQEEAGSMTGDGHGQPVFLPSRKRKRSIDEIDDGNDEMTSFQVMKVDQAQYLQSLDPLDLIDPALLEADPADWSLANFFSSPEPRNVASSLSDAEYVASAQALADQAIFRTLRIPFLTDNINKDYYYARNGVDEHSVKNIIQQNLMHAVKSCFDRATECTMAAFVTIQDLLQQTGQISRPLPRPMPWALPSSDPMKPNSIFIIPAPHLEVQRSESKLAVLPPAVPFWENLGLAPCKGSKDVNAICIYPDGEGIADSVDAFLDQIRNAYESSRLGSHERFSHADLVEGHVPMDFGDSAMLSVADHQAVLLRIKETSTRVGALLAAGPISESSIVIYYVYDSQSPEILIPICSAFNKLFEVYKESLADEKLPVSNELVFQLVPLNFIASKASLVIPPPSEYMRLAMEVYDRCVDLNTGTSVPSIILEQPLPRAIDFKQTPNPSASPLQENSCLHVAYAASLDDRWITAAWTDNTGSRQMTASYCLGRRHVPLTLSFSEVAQEVWETTMAVIAIQKVNWRVMIAKSGVMDYSEIEVWKALAAAESNAQVTLTLITVDTSPSLELLPHSISVAPNVLAAHSSVYTTPVSTPQASIISPEPGNAATPTRDTGPVGAATPNDSNTELKIDADATLVDITDQTWGAILSHRLNNSRSLLEFKPTLISGYLIKRSGAAPSDMPIVIEVNIVHSELYPRMYDPLLKEVLGLYRGFATLARVRGCVDPVKDGRPWHVAAVEKAVQALYVLI